jgi:hypothetical protein
VAQPLFYGFSQQKVDQIPGNTWVDPKFSGPVPPSTQQLW